MSTKFTWEREGEICARNAAFASPLFRKLLIFTQSRTIHCAHETCTDSGSCCDNEVEIWFSILSALSLPGTSVVEMLERVARERGYPDGITVDNGPELRGRALDGWAFDHGVQLWFIDAGKPTQNAYIESFNGRFREECLNLHWFTSLAEAQRIIEEWRTDYNMARPHSSLKYQTPEEFASNRPFHKTQWATAPEIYASTPLPIAHAAQ